MKIIFALCAFAILAGCYNPEDNCRNDRTAKIGAYLASQRYVESLLRSPSTADFPSFTARGVIVTYERRCEFRVASYVDAQNGFGATTRTRYILDVEADPEEGGYAFTNLILE